MLGRFEEKSAANGRLTIGFLDENSYYDYHNLIMKGIYDAAQKYGVNVVRFSLFTGHILAKSVSHEDLFLESIKQFRLDGLIFLGWARSLENRDIGSIFGELPIFSLGAGKEGIPSSIFPGAEYIRETLLHLVKCHNYRNIAFIGPFWYDRRVDTYINIMKGFGIHDPLLFIDGSELEDLDFYERGVRAVQILLDERQVKCDAIVSLFNDEAYAVSTELKRRGIRIPEDIALTSYEDGESGKFSNPAFTTVYFPWEELGYHACESMYRRLQGEQQPHLTTVPGRIIYRGSCGCIPDSVNLSEPGELPAVGKSFEDLDERELDGIIDDISSETDLTRAEAARLMGKFRQAFLSRSNTQFMIDAEYIIRNMCQGGRKTQHLAATLRKILLPYFLEYTGDASEGFVWAEDIFFQIQVMIREKLVNISFKEDVKHKNIRLRLKETGQILITNFNVKSLLDSLEINLPKLGIQGCYIYIFDKENSARIRDNRLEFEYSGSKRIMASDVQGQGIREGFWELMKEDRPYFISTHLLHNGEDFIGMAAFEPSHLEMGVYQTVAMQLNTSLNSINLFNMLDAGYSRLMDQAHKKGMADISTGILHNIGNILNNINATADSLVKLLEYNAINDLIMANNLLESKFDEMEEYALNDPKCRTLMLYYISLNDGFESLRRKLQEHISRMSDKIELIDEIITAQQGYTAVKTNLNALDLTVILNDVLKMHQTSMDKHGIRAVRNYGRPVRAYANRTKLFHVLTNIVKNAMEAMDDTPAEKKNLAISVTEDGEKAFIRIRDSGSGIAPEHLENIFAYGFSTKADGHGFGLHSCANYMTEMNGKLWAESEGAGSGATFVLQLKKQEERPDKG